MTSGFSPFAITARTLGHPRKLHTPLLLFNAGDTLAAARVNAMWDTGAEVCIMSRTLADRLGYSFDRQMLSHGIAGSCMATYGMAAVSLINGDTMVETMAAIVDGDLGPDYSFIIGLSLISRGTLILNHTPTETVLTFAMPPVELPDLTASQPERKRAVLPLSATPESLRTWYGEDVLPLLAGL